MKRLILICSFFISICTLNAGSILSSSGIGRPLALPNAAAMAKGGLSIGVYDPFTINQYNPAGLHGITLTRFSLHFISEYNQLKSSEGEAALPYTNFNGFSFAVPIASKWAIALSLKPLTRLDYELTFQNSLQEENYEKSVSGSGGINSVDFSVAYSLNRFITFGLTRHHYFGKSKENWLVIYDASDFNISQTTYNDHYKGTGWTCGLHIRPVNALTIGALYSVGSTMDTESYRTYEVYKDTLNGNLTLPGSYGIGFTYQASLKFMFGVDFTVKDWSDFKLDGHKMANAANQNSVALGCEYRPSLDPYATLVNRTVYRLGANYSPYYVQDINGKNIDEFWITAGLGFPVFQNSSRLNMAIALGKRGSLDKNGIRENLFRFMISLDAGEKWFVRSHR